MKKIYVFLSLIFFVSCGVSQQKELLYRDEVDSRGSSSFENGVVKISNPEEEYEVIIYDTGFESWFRSNARQRGYYSKSFLEMKNRIWVMNFNSRNRMGTSGYDYIIDYTPAVDYGYEVNYMLYHYLQYFQQMNRVRLD